MIHIPNYDLNNIGGPTTFMRNMSRYLERVEYKVESEPYFSKGIFFPVAVNTDLLDYYKKIDGFIIQRLDGVYYPSQHGPGFEEQNRDIRMIYNNYATKVVFQSIYSKKQCFEMLGVIKQDSYSIIHNGVDQRLFFPARYSELKNSKFTLISTGNFRKMVMLEPIVQALDSIYSDHPFELVLIGRISDKRLETLVERPYIRFLGEKRDIEVAEWLRLADAYIHSQLNDNCPNAVLEAITSGLPVVGFNSGAMSELCHFSPDLLAETSNKLLHEPLDFDASLLEKKIRLLIQNHTYFKELSLSNSGLYHFDVCGNAYTKLFESELNLVKGRSIPLSYVTKGMVKLLKRNSRDIRKRLLRR